MQIRSSIYSPCGTNSLINMTSHAFGAFIDVESSPTTSHPEDHAIPIAPQKAHERTYHSVPIPGEPDAIGLDYLQWGSKLNSSRSEAGQNTPPGTQTPGATDLEMSRPVTPTGNEQAGVDIMQSFSNPPMNRFRMFSICLMLFGNGLVDSAPGGGCSLSSFPVPDRSKCLSD